MKKDHVHVLLFCLSIGLIVIVSQYFWDKKQAADTIKRKYEHHIKDSINQIEYAAQKKTIAIEDSIRRETILKTVKNGTRLLKLIDEYGDEKGRVIFKGSIRVGFTDDMCREAWGRPEDINRTTSKYGRSEQWVYPGGSILYFEDGVLTTIQN